MLDYLPRTVEIIIKLYFYLVIFKFLLDMLQAQSNNAFTVFVRRLTVPYIYFISSRCRGVFKIYAGLIALVVLMWLEAFLPAVLRHLIHAPAAANTPVDIFMIFIGVTFFTLKSVLFFFGIISLIYFLILLSAVPLNNPFVSSLMLMVEPMLSYVRRIVPVKGTDYSPLILSVSLFAVYFLT